MSTPAYRSNATAEQTGGTSITISKPSGVVDGDFLLCVLVQDASGMATPSCSGWTVIDSGSGAAGSLYTLQKIANGEGASWTFNYSGSAGNSAGAVVAFSSVAGAGSVDARATPRSNSSTTSETANAATTTLLNDLVVFVCGLIANSSSTPPSGMTERVDFQHSGGYVSIEIADVLQAAAGTTGTKTGTSANSGSNFTQLICLKAQTLLDSGALLMSM